MSQRGGLVAARLGPEHLLYERYRDPQSGSGVRRAYYRLKPLMPRRLQLGLRRAYAPLQARRQFPAWPIEPTLVRHQQEEFRRRLHESHGDRLPFVNFWPRRARFCVVLTHDVEGPEGIENIERVREVERRLGFVSSWNFVAEDYELPPGLFADLRRDGCEIGLHGLRHDDTLFRDRTSFEAQLPRIAAYLECWKAAGFRTPSTHRNAEWMHELPCRYDSSFPDTDPFEPMPGGCCSIFPFFLGGVVELPITLAQDHTLFEILREPSIAIWRRKSEWLIEHHGMINVITHPDYLAKPDRLALYEELLEFLAQQEEGWHELPMNVADWWRERERLEVQVAADGSLHVAGGHRFAGSVAYARDDAGTVVFET